MNTQQAAHYKMLAEAHKDTPGDLAAAYRVIGELLDTLSAFCDSVENFIDINESPDGLTYSGVQLRDQRYMDMKESLSIARDAS